MSRKVVLVVAALAASSFAAPVGAHISLLEPAARYDGSVSQQSKACPCGVGESNRLCDVEGDRSDPDRSTRVTTLEAGSLVKMRWDEYVGHSGRYRIAFDADGADLDDFNANILMDFVDPAGGAGNIGEGSIWEVEFVVPDMPCNNCTLQLIQMMDGNTTDPVPDPIGRSSYYQCADIVIVPAGGDTGNPPQDMGPGPDPIADTGTDTDAAGPAPSPGDTGVNPEPGEPDAATHGDLGATGNVNGTGGCGCRSVSGDAGSGLLVFGALVVGRRRRRQSRRASEAA